MLIWQRSEHLSLRYQELCFSAFVLGAAIASDNCRYSGNMPLRHARSTPMPLPPRLSPAERTKVACEGLASSGRGEVRLRTSHPERSGREGRPTRRRVSQTRRTRRSRKGRFDRTDGPWTQRNSATQPRIQVIPESIASSAFGGTEPN
jgi:hypothetical protein